MSWGKCTMIYQLAGNIQRNLQSMIKFDLEQAMTALRWSIGRLYRYLIFILAARWGEKSKTNTDGFNPCKETRY